MTRYLIGALLVGTAGGASGAWATTQLAPPSSHVRTTYLFPVDAPAKPAPEKRKTELAKKLVSTVGVPGSEKTLEAYADMAVDASEQHGVSPELLLAVAMWETGLDHRKRGAAGEVGAWQLMPVLRSGNVTAAGKTRYYKDAAYRTRCHKRTDGCQKPLAMLAAAHLAKGMGLCGSEHAALGRYQSGKCGGNRKYADGVTAIQRRLER